MLNIERKKEKYQGTTELADIVKKAIPKFDSKKNPATKTFQAIRIKVNEELSEIEQVLPAAFKALRKKWEAGSLFSFHSLEDRIIKNFIKNKIEYGHSAKKNSNSSKNKLNQPL